MSRLVVRAAGGILRAVRKKTGLGLPKTRPVFIHIPKTAGRSIGRMMKAAYWGQPILWVPSEAELGMSKEEFDRYAVYRGHVAASFAKRVKNPFVFTFLREPMDRLISEYYFVRSKGVSIPSLAAYLEKESTDNGMTRALVGSASAEEAIEALSTMDFVGTVETFNEDTERLFRLLGRGVVAPLKWKPNFARPALEDLAPKVRSALELRTEADRKIYEWALRQR